MYGLRVGAEAEALWYDDVGFDRFKERPQARYGLWAALDLWEHGPLWLGAEAGGAYAESESPADSETLTLRLRRVRLHGGLTLGYALFAGQAPGLSLSPYLRLTGGAQLATLRLSGQAAHDDMEAAGALGTLGAGVDMELSLILPSKRRGGLGLRLEGGMQLGTPLDFTPSRDLAADAVPIRQASWGTLDPFGAYARLAAYFHF